MFNGTTIPDLEETVIDVEKSIENVIRFRDEFCVQKQEPKKLAVVLPFRKPVTQ